MFLGIIFCRIFFLFINTESIQLTLVVLFHRISHFGIPKSFHASFNPGKWNHDVNRFLVTV